MQLNSINFISQTSQMRRPQKQKNTSNSNLSFGNVILKNIRNISVSDVPYIYRLNHYLKYLNPYVTAVVTSTQAPIEFHIGNRTVQMGCGVSSEENVLISTYKTLKKIARAQGIKAISLPEKFRTIMKNTGNTQYDAQNPIIKALSGIDGITIEGL